MIAVNAEQRLASRECAALIGYQEVMASRRQESALGDVEKGADGDRSMLDLRASEKMNCFSVSVSLASNPLADALPFEARPGVAPISQGLTPPKLKDASPSVERLERYFRRAYMG